MTSDVFYDPEIFIKSYEEALKQNERTLNKIRNFKKELEDVKTNLEQNQNHLYQSIMVPIGNKALIKGKLVHTNEVTINVGDRWFIKKSAAGAIETCNRMIERCNQNLAEYEKEMNLLSSNLEAPKDYGIFASEDVQEIVEPYDEDEEKRWREQHRKNVRQYRQQLAMSKKVLPKRVSFSESLESTQEYSTSVDDDISIIQFKHSQHPVKILQIATPDGIINSPSDIYKKYLTNFDNVTRKSILKKCDLANQDELPDINNPCSNEVLLSKFGDSIPNKSEKIQKSIIKIQRNSTDSNTFLSLDEISSDEVFGDIVERTPTVVSTVESNSRPVSKFKQLRNKNVPS